MSDRRRMKLTSEQVFARWWAKHQPHPQTIVKHAMTETHLQLLHDWACIAFYRGYDLGRKRAQEKARG